jgi:hypothetical protein
LTTSSGVALKGLQRPRLLHVPSGAASSSGAEAVELAALAGLELDPWQAFTLDVGLSERANGKWLCFEVGLWVSRQNGKGGVLEARELAGLFLLHEPLIIHSAHEFKTSKEAFYRLRRIIENCPDLDRQVQQIKQSNEEVSILTKSGSRLRYLARKGGTGRGFSGDCVILDEAMILDPESIGALLPTLSARPNPQLWYTGSAAMATSEVFHSVRKRGLAGTEESLAWLEWSAPEGSHHDDVDAWAQANPALGIRILPESIERERAAMASNPRMFARERLGIPDPLVGVESVITALAWEALMDRSSEVTGRKVLGVDVAPDGMSASIVGVGRRSDGLPHVETVDSRQGTWWLIDRLAQVAPGNEAIAVNGAGPAGAMLPEIVRAAGQVPVKEINGRDYAASCEAFLIAITEDRLRHLGDILLAPAVCGAARRPVSDGWVWDRKHRATDITPLVAATVALRALEQLADTVYAGSFVDLDDY